MGKKPDTVRFMTTHATTLDTLKHVGGDPALDFVNTVHHWIGTGPQREYLADYADLLRWARDADVVDAHAARVLAQAAATHPRSALRMYRDALALREAIHEIMQASIVQRAADARLTQVFDHWYRRALRTRGATVDARGRFSVEWCFGGNPLPLDVPLLKLAWAAARFLRTVEPGRLKQCPAEPGCGWLFHDTSKNRSRRWCDMSDCGNTAKARRHYARVRKARTG